MTDERVEGSDAAEDRRLVARFLGSRSDEAFLRLYDRHTPGLYRFAARLAGRSGAEPAELVQEAWVRAVSRLEGFRWGSSLRTWLCGIVLNRWRETRRAEERDRRIVALVEREARIVTVPEPALSVALEQAIGELPEGYREILLLHDVEGYTHERSPVTSGSSKARRRASCTGPASRYARRWPRKERVIGA